MVDDNAELLVNLNDDADVPQSSSSLRRLQPDDQAETTQRGRHIRAHNNDALILEQLGIIGEPGASVTNQQASVAANSQPATPQHQIQPKVIDNDSEIEDDAALFDHDTLISSRRRAEHQGHRRQASNESGTSRSMLLSTGSSTMRIRADTQRTLMCRAVLVSLAFFAIGMCQAMIGPTLPDLMVRTHAATLQSTVCAITSMAFGAMLGCSMGGMLYPRLSAFCIMAVALLFVSCLTAIIPFCSTLSGLVLLCFVYGAAIGVVERGGYTLYYAYWRRRPRALQLFCVMLALGSCVAPLVTTPFVFDSIRYTAGLNNTQPSLRLRRAAQDEVVSGEDNSTLTTVVANLTTIVPAHIKPKVSNGDEKQEVPIASKIHQKEKDAEILKQQQTSMTTGGPSLFSMEQSDSTAAIDDLTTQDTTEEATTATQAEATTEVPITTTTTVTVTTSTVTQPITSTSTPATVTNQSVVVSTSGESVSRADRWWDQMRLQVEQLNKVQFAYVLVAGLCSTCLLLYTLMCCCVPCRTLHKLPAASGLDERMYNPMTLCAHSDTRLASALAAIYCFFCVCVESSLASLLTVYVLLRARDQDTGHKSIAQSMAMVGGDQQSGALLTFVFWLGVAIGRSSAVLIERRWLSQQRVLCVCVCTGCALSGILAVFGHGQYGAGNSLLWLCVGGQGVAVGPLFPLGYLWLDAQLQLSPWFAGICLLAGNMGRVVWPLGTAVSLSALHARMLPLWVLSAWIGVAVLFLFVRRAAKTASHLLAVDELSRHVRGQASGDRGDTTGAEYTRIHFDGTTEMLSGLGLGDANGSAHHNSALRMGQGHTQSASADTGFLDDDDDWLIEGDAEDMPMHSTNQHTELFDRYVPRSTLK